jgi:hypothetical protein
MESQEKNNKSQENSDILHQNILSNFNWALFTILLNEKNDSHSQGNLILLLEFCYSKLKIKHFNHFDNVFCNLKQICVVAYFSIYYLPK